MKSEKDIRYIKGVGEKRAELFHKLGIFDADALLRFYPRKYLDLKNTVSLREVQVYDYNCVKAKIITDVKEEARRNLKIFTFLISDGTDTAKVVLFNQNYLANGLKMGETYIFYGKVTLEYSTLKFESPIIKPLKDSKITPIYPQTANLSSTVIAKIVANALQSEKLQETLPWFILEKYGLIDINKALNLIHFPTTMHDVALARKRLAFEELLTLQLGMALRRFREEQKKGVPIVKNYLSEYHSLLPFSLTEHQLNVINDCFSDFKKQKPMARLIEGDVGSGKTAIAAALMHTVAKNGYQSAFMAPTEILAEQHFHKLTELFQGTEITLGILTGASTVKQKREIKEKLKKGQIDIIIGTHALIQDDVNFKSLALVITDEQHRFGVKQRTILQDKGHNPHLAVMSATPIPRTLSLVIYGDLDISTVAARPAGRQPIDTFAVNMSYRERIYTFIKKELDKGRQAYIICPAVSESDSGIAAAEEYSKDIEEIFQGYEIGMLHGKLKPKEKDRIMREFADGSIKLLVATTVVEVGIDVPNATVMVIENAERFGLSQLHQLRGRIGRGQHKSTCILVSNIKSGTTKQRLDVLCKTNNGFEIAEYDLKLRGPGDFCGSRQHGLPELKIADLMEDLNLFKASVHAAEEILKHDPNLNNNKPLLHQVVKLYKTAEQYGSN